MKSTKLENALKHSVSRKNQARFYCRKLRKTPAVSCGGSLRACDGRSGSEVTLNANVERDGVLVLELVGGRRLGSRRRQHGSAGEVLIEVEPHHFGRERQVLDRCPAGDHAELRDVIVRVAAEVRGGVRGGQLVRCDIGSTKLALGRGDVERIAVVAHGGEAAEQARRPVRIPVVVERTADTKSPGQLPIA